MFNLSCTAGFGACWSGLGRAADGGVVRCSEEGKGVGGGIVLCGISGLAHVLRAQLYVYAKLPRYS